MFYHYLQNLSCSRGYQHCCRDTVRGRVNRLRGCRETRGHSSARDSTPRLNRRPRANAGLHVPVRAWGPTARVPRGLQKSQRLLLVTSFKLILRLSSLQDSGPKTIVRTSAAIRFAVRSSRALAYDSLRISCMQGCH